MNLFLAAEAAKDASSFDLGDLSLQIAVGVAITLIAAIVIAVLAAIWRRRWRPLNWAASSREALAERERRIERASHDELMRHVLLRAEVLGIELPVKVTRGNLAIVTLHPSGETHARYRDLPSYRDAVNRGKVSPMRASFGKPPLAVSSWSDDRLRAWLREHADDVPPSKSRAA